MLRGSHLGRLQIGRQRLGWAPLKLGGVPARRFRDIPSAVWAEGTTRTYFFRKSKKSGKEERWRSDHKSCERATFLVDCHCPTAFWEKKGERETPGEATQPPSSMPLAEAT